MSTCLLDSSAFLALESSEEFDHERTVAAYNRLLDDRIQLVTTNFVFDETYTLMLVRLGRNRAIEWGDRLLASSSIGQVPIQEEHEMRAWQLIKNFSDKDFSYTDATSFVVADALGIEQALSLDDHFRQYGRLNVLP